MLKELEEKSRTLALLQAKAAGTDGKRSRHGKCDRQCLGALDSECSGDTGESVRYFAVRKGPEAPPRPLSRACRAAVDERIS